MIHARIGEATLNLATLALVFVVALASMTHFDFWWYLKSGEYIVQHGIPAGDPFSYTAEGKPWINHMWLTQVLLYWAHEGWGRVPIIVIKSLLVTLTFAVVLATALARGAHPVVAAGVTALAALAGQGYWHVRPQVITYLLLAVYLHLLRPGWETRRRSLWWVPALMVPWANLHAGFVSGLGLLGVILTGEALERLLDRTRQQWGALFGLAAIIALTAALSLVNPFGIRAVVFPLEVVSSREFMTTTIEWFSPNFHDSQYRPFEAMILLLFVGVGLTKWARPADLVLAATFTHLGLSSVRHIPLFAVAVTPILAQVLSVAVSRLAEGPSVARWRAHATRLMPSLWPVLRAPLTHAAIGGVLLLAMLAGYAARVLDPAVGALAQDLNQERYPIRTTEFMKRERVPGPLFNVYVWGGFTLWQLYPDYKVFFDGRTHVYGERVVRDYLDVALLSPRWRTVLDRWQVQSVLTYPNYPLTQALYASPDWRLVFVDREALLFVRDLPAHQVLFERVGPVPRPGGSTVQDALARAVRAAERGAGTEAERGFEHVLRLDADNPVALYSLALLLARRGAHEEAARLGDRLVAAHPHSELAKRLERELRGRP